MIIIIMYEQQGELGTGSASDACDLNSPRSDSANRVLNATCGPRDVGDWRLVE